MAVYHTLTLYPQYYSDSIPGCVGGGEDYRTVAKQGTEIVYLAVDPQMSGLSSKCELTKVEILGKTRLTNASGNSSGLTLKATVIRQPVQIINPSISGTEMFNFSTKALGPADDISLIGHMDYDSYLNTLFNYSVDVNQNSINTENNLIGAKISLVSVNSLVSCRIWLKDIQIKITRKRACNITFNPNIEGVSSQTTTYDYGTIPSYSGNLSKTGYDFKGWKSSDGQTYTGTLPAAGEIDVTYTAVWELKKYTLTVAADIGGSVTGGGVYTHGTVVTITAIPKNGYSFIQWSSGGTNLSKSITVTEDYTHIATFKRLYCDIGYDNLFSFTDWYYLNGNDKGAGSGSGTVTTDFQNKTITIDGSGDFYTYYSNFITDYNIPVEQNVTYKFKYDILSGKSTQAFIFFINDNNEWVYKSNGGTYYEVKYDGSPITFTPPPGCTRVTLRLGINETSKTVFSNIALYKIDQEYNLPNIQYQKIFNFGEAVGELYTPERPGYDFLGWYYLDTNEKVSPNDVFIKSRSIYSLWKINKINKIKIDTDLSKNILIDSDNIKKVLVDNIKVYG